MLERWKDRQGRWKECVWATTHPCWVQMENSVNSDRRGLLSLSQSALNSCSISTLGVSSGLLLQLWNNLVNLWASSGIAKTLSTLLYVLQNRTERRMLHLMRRHPERAIRESRGLDLHAVFICYKPRRLLHSLEILSPFFPSLFLSGFSDTLRLCGVSSDFQNKQLMIKERALGNRKVGCKDSLGVLAGVICVWNLCCVKTKTDTAERKFESIKICHVLKKNSLLCILGNQIWSTKTERRDIFASMGIKFQMFYISSSSCCDVCEESDEFFFGNLLIRVHCTVPEVPSVSIFCLHLWKGHT